MGVQFHPFMLAVLFSLHLLNRPAFFWASQVGGGKESASQCRKCKRHRFDPWVRKIPWSRKWQAVPVFLPGKFHWQEEPGGSWQFHGIKKSPAWLSTHTHIHTSFLRWIFLAPLLQLVSRMCMGLFLGSLFCSIDQVSVFMPLPHCSNRYSFVM